MTDYWIRFGSSSFHPTRHRPQIADTWRSKFWQILSTTSGGNLSILILDNWAYLRASPSHGPDNPSRRRWHPTKPGIQCHISPRLYDWGVTPQILSDKNVPHHQFITLYRLGIGYQYQLGRGNMIHLTNYNLDLYRSRNKLRYKRPAHIISYEYNYTADTPPDTDTVLFTSNPSWDILPSNWKLLRKTHNVNTCSLQCSKWRLSDRLCWLLHHYRTSLRPTVTESHTDK